MGMVVRRNWRKSSQWIAIGRSHAQLLMDDREISTIFQRHCHSGYDRDYHRFRDCFSDEHLLPVLLSYHGLSQETDCLGKLVSVDFGHKAVYHPKSYKPKEVSSSLLIRIRDKRGACKSMALIQRSWESYRIAADSANLDDICRTSPKFAKKGGQAPSKQPAVLDYKCPLFARKFPKDTAGQVLSVFQECNTNLHIIANSSCITSVDGLLEKLEQYVGNSRSTRLLLGAVYV